MRYGRSMVALAILALAPAAAEARQDAVEQYPLEVRVWLDRGLEPVLRRGDRVRVYYRTSEDAYVAIFHIDTDGSIRLVFPRSPDEGHRAAGGRDYRLLFPQSQYWHVDEYEGKGYFFALASPVPFDFSGLRYLPYERVWDLSPVGRAVYEDPYVAMDDYVAALLPEWETLPYALDFIEYDVGGTHDYPRFLCYDCHGFRSYASWNPYTYACTSFRVVIWDDPYFYPTYRYGPTRVVYTGSRKARARFAFKERTAGEAWSPLTRTRQPAQRRSVQYLEPSAAEPDRPRIAPPRRRAMPAEQARPASAAAPGRGEARPAPRRGEPLGTPIRSARPSGRPTERAATPREGATRAVTPPATTQGARPSESRPTLQRRPAAPARPEARPAPGRPSTPGARPTRPSGGATPSRGVRPDTRRPQLRPGSRPTARPSAPAGGRVRVVRPPTPSRPSAGRPSARPAQRPTVRPRPGGSSARPSRPQRPPPRPKPKRPKKKPGG